MRQWKGTLMATKYDPNAPMGPDGKPTSSGTGDGLQDPAGGLKKGDEPGQTPAPMAAEVGNAQSAAGGATKKYVVQNKGSIVHRGGTGPGEYHEGDTVEMTDAQAKPLVDAGTLKPA